MMPRPTAPPAAAPADGPPPRAVRIHREWKGERGRAVRIAQYGLAFRARQSLDDLLDEMADLGGGPACDAHGHFRALRRIVAGGGRATRDEMRAELGVTSWCRACRDLILRGVLVMEREPASDVRRFRLEPRIALQVGRALATIDTTWRPVVARRWEDATLVCHREGRDAGDATAMRDVVARLFDLSEADGARDHGAIWSTCRRLARDVAATGGGPRDVPGGDLAPRDADADADADDGAAEARDRLCHAALVDAPAGPAPVFLAASLAPATRAAFVEAVETLDAFAAPPPRA